MAFSALGARIDAEVALTVPSAVVDAKELSATEALVRSLSDQMSNILYECRASLRDRMFLDTKSTPESDVSRLFEYYGLTLNLDGRIEPQLKLLKDAVENERVAAARNKTVINPLVPLRCETLYREITRYFDECKHNAAEFIADHDRKYINPIAEELAFVTFNSMFTNRIYTAIDERTRASLRYPMTGKTAVIATGIQSQETSIPAVSKIPVLSWEIISRAAVRSCVRSYAHGVAVRAVTRTQASVAARAKLLASIDAVKLAVQKTETGSVMSDIDLASRLRDNPDFCDAQKLERMIGVYGVPLSKVSVILDEAADALTKEDRKKALRTGANRLATVINADFCNAGRPCTRHTPDASPTTLRSFPTGNSLLTEDKHGEYTVDPACVSRLDVAVGEDLGKSLFLNHRYRQSCRQLVVKAQREQKLLEEMNAANDLDWIAPIATRKDADEYVARLVDKFGPEWRERLSRFTKLDDESFKLDHAGPRVNRDVATSYSDEFRQIRLGKLKLDAARCLAMIINLINKRAAQPDPVVANLKAEVKAVAEGWMKAAEKNERFGPQYHLFSDAFDRSFAAVWNEEKTGKDPLMAKLRKACATSDAISQLLNSVSKQLEQTVESQKGAFVKLRALAHSGKAVSGAASETSKEEDAASELVVRSTGLSVGDRSSTRAFLLSCLEMCDKAETFMNTAIENSKKAGSSTSDLYAVAFSSSDWKVASTALWTRYVLPDAFQEAVPGLGTHVVVPESKSMLEHKNCIRLERSRSRALALFLISGMRAHVHRTPSMPPEGLNVYRMVLALMELRITINILTGRAVKGWVFT